MYGVLSSKFKNPLQRVAQDAAWQVADRLQTSGPAIVVMFGWL
jgi:hypothetical protein